VEYDRLSDILCLCVLQIFTYQKEIKLKKYKTVCTIMNVPESYGKNNWCGLQIFLIASYWYFFHSQYLKVLCLFPPDVTTVIVFFGEFTVKLTIRLLPEFFE